MGIRINTNVSSINTQRHLLNSTNMFAKSMERLSSGLRINRAGDDAAGLAISEGLKSDLRALDQAARNAGDGISLVQIGEGSLDEVSNILLRMKELAEQSLNGTLSNTERTYLNSEFSNLTSEINRISDSTEFNGVKLLDGSESSPIKIQVGIGTATADSVSIDLSDDLDAAGIGITGSIDTSANATTAMGQNDQCHACGTFTETLTFSDNDDEGCRFSEWPDSAYWTIDGEATRECIYIEANCGYWNETYPGIHNCKAVNSISPCVELGIHASLIMTACSISVIFGKIIINGINFGNIVHRQWRGIQTSNPNIRLHIAIVFVKNAVLIFVIPHTV